MNKKISLGAAIAFILIVATATIVMTLTYSNRAYDAKMNNLKKREVMYEKFTEIDRQTREHYTGSINETQLMDSVAQGYIQGIGDKYARYIPAEEFAKRNAQGNDGDNVGIGAVIDVSSEGFLVVREVYPDSPAQVAGMMAGDLIVTMDGEDLNMENVTAKSSAISGVQGSTVSFVVRRGGEEFTMEMPRRTVIAPTVYSNIIPETSVAYIYIKEFGANTSDQFNRELDRMLSAGAKGIVFDLRDNKGGVMRQATRILDRLIPAGIIYTAQRSDGTVESATSDGNAIDLPMAVLTNGGTENAAELFAQVLKDYEKARTVGTVTAGKGALLDIVRLSDGSALELTVAYYNPPVSPSFEGVGVAPDYDVATEEDWTLLLQENDPQVKKAVEVVTAQEKVRENVEAQQSEEDSSQEDDEK